MAYPVCLGNVILNGRVYTECAREGGYLCFRCGLNKSNIGEQEGLSPIGVQKDRPEPGL